MKRFSYSRVGLPLLGAVAVAAAALGFSGVASSTPSGGASASPYFGRWQVNDPEARYSARGRVYKMIDIAPCGRDFCGVSVSDSGQCGQTLFRFYSRNRGNSRLMGHAVWGTGKKDLTIDSYGESASEAGLDLYIGNGHDFGERGGSMPMFNASYEKRGTAQCRSR